MTALRFHRAAFFAGRVKYGHSLPMRDDSGRPLLDPVPGEGSQRASARLAATVQAEAARLADVRALPPSRQVQRAHARRTEKAKAYSRSDWRARGVA